MLNLSIALRYIFGRKSHNVVNIISAVAVSGIAVASAAIVIVLSVFNGFSGLVQSRFSLIDPDLLVVPASGKIIESGDSIARVIDGIEGVEFAVPSLSERGIVMAADDSQVPVVFKGVDSIYYNMIDLNKITDYYKNTLPGDTLPHAVISLGVASHLNNNENSPLSLYTLRRIGRINPANPLSAFNSSDLSVTRIVSIDQPEFDDDHIFIPLQTARQLLQYYDGECSAIEIKVDDNADAEVVRKNISRRFPSLKVLSKTQQHQDSYNMIAIEKWVTFSMLIFILVIAAFNIISTLSLMVIEKRDNMDTLHFLGADQSFIKNIFGLIAVIITFMGGIIGIVVGLALSFAQQWGGFIKLSGDSSLLSITAYPVSVRFVDILAVLAIILLVAVLSAVATNFFTRKHSRP